MTAAFIVLSGGLRTRYLFFSKHRISKVKRNNLLPLIFPFSHYMKNNGGGGGGGGNMHIHKIKQTQQKQSWHIISMQRTWPPCRCPCLFYKTIWDELTKKLFISVQTLHLIHIPPSILFKQGAINSDFTGHRKQMDKMVKELIQLKHTVYFKMDFVYIF